MVLLLLWDEVSEQGESSDFGDIHLLLEVLHQVQERKLFNEHAYMS